MSDGTPGPEVTGPAAARTGAAGSGGPAETGAAATGRPAETEAVATGRPAETVEAAGGGLHGRPTARELVDAVAGFLRDQLEPHVEGALRYQVRVAVRALEVVAREVELGPVQEAAHQSRLAALGLDDDAALAAAIRDGRFDEDPGLRELVDALRSDARDRLLVANPRWLLSDRA